MQHKIHSAHICKGVAQTQPWLHRLMLSQWWTFPLVSGHRSTKSPKPPVFQTLIRALVQLKYRSGGLVSHCFYDATDKPKPQVSAKCKHIGMCIQTAGASRFGWSKQLAMYYTVHGQSAPCCIIIVCKAEPKITVWSETSLWQLFLDWL